MLEGFGEMKKTSGYRPKLKSEVNTRDQVGEGSETKVFRAELGYKDGKVVDGFVYKMIHPSGGAFSGFERLQMQDMLQKWNRIKEIKHELVKNHREGFNIPGTVRSYRDEAGAGILMTDLSRGGELTVTDLKDSSMFQESQKAEKWRKVREAVLRDVDIAIENGVDLSGSPFPLDPWVLVYDPRHDTYEIFLVDIGRYVKIYQPSEASEKILRQGREYIVEALDKLESKVTGEK